MKRNLHMKNVLFLFFLFSSLLPSLTIEAQSSKTALAGQVTDKQGQPLEGITVTINELAKSVSTDADGNYHFKQVPGGSYTITVTGVNVTAVKKQISITQGSRAKLDFQLENSVKELNSVTITAAGLRRKIYDVPGSISVIDPRTIRESGAQSLTEIITRIPGVVAVDEDGRGLKPNFGLRGLDPNRNRSALILIDGKIPNGTMYYGDPGGYYMTPLQQVEKIEVIRGGASVLYGGHSVGGVINLISKKATSTPSTQLNLNYGSWNALTAQVTSGANNGKFGYMVNGVRRQGDGFRDRSKFGVNDVTVKLENSIDTTTKLSVYLNGFSENSETPGGLTQTQFDQNIKQSQHPFDHFISDRYTATLSLDKQLRNSQQLNTSIYGNYFKRNWYTSRKKSAASTSFDTTIAFIRDIHAIGVVADYLNNSAIGGLENAFVAGVRIHTDRLNDMTMTAGTANQEVGKASAFAISTSFIKELYAYNTINFLPRLSFSLGARYTAVTYKKEDYTSKNPLTGNIGLKAESTSDAVVYSTGLVYKFDAANNVFLNVSKSFQPPLIYTAMDVNTFYYAEKLNPETSMNYEIGVRTQPAGWLSANLTGYIINFKNKLVQAPTPDGRYRVWQNIGTSSHHGVEAEINIYPLQHLSLYASGAYQEAKQTSGATKDKYLVYAPKVTYTAGLRYGNKLGSGQFAANAWFTYVGKQYTDLTNTEAAGDNGQTGPVPAYHPANISFQYTLNSWGINFVMNNVFDEKYFTKREGSFWEGIVPMPGRNINVGISYRF
ncbi:TonB-dependent receptor [Sediminibacterium soli]|uniref:TonB-dependent receptor n=1 Tax=Sediminibacterium soli TaxID=2698829 RepID=UPI00137A2165|nr:TonB-dependent receptor [Sediminibacterium soli]NCI48270.1 TonB-dependent receptor [Sediminibacterium soli]